MADKDDTPPTYHPGIGLSLLPGLPRNRAKQIEREVRAGFITPDEGHRMIREERRALLLRRMRR